MPIKYGCHPPERVTALRVTGRGPHLSSRAARDSKPPLIGVLYYGALLSGLHGNTALPLRAMASAPLRLGDDFTGEEELWYSPIWAPGKARSLIGGVGTPR